MRDVAGQNLGTGEDDRRDRQQQDEPQSEALGYQLPKHDRESLLPETPVANAPDALFGTRNRYGLFPLAISPPGKAVIHRQLSLFLATMKPQERGKRSR
ncbi:hypothetical protein FRZ61_25940 [Hypericibacter adhaerens]|uniref:Uncharacterized protein n=1 Tax=Hypericibacter adhaerens TaxID=2602016 RepID=A0A5J6MY37_9PROT|nr:hypothetical protein FRZ61_25940 [Hypericibacter adhaerens]